MPDDPFLTKLRGGAASDPFLAKMRGGGTAVMETDEQRGQREYNAQADADLASGRSTVNTDDGGFQRTGRMGAKDFDALAEGSSRVNAAARAEHPYMTRVGEAALAPVRVPIEGTADLIESQQPGGRSFDKSLPWDEIGANALRSGGAVAFAPVEVATAPVAPLLDPALKKADEYIGQSAAYAVAGMPDAPQSLKPGEQGRLPTSETVREGTNLAAMLAGGKMLETGAQEFQFARGVRPNAAELAARAPRPAVEGVGEPPLDASRPAPQVRFVEQKPDVNHRPYVEPPKALDETATTPEARRLPTGGPVTTTDGDIVPPYDPATPVDEFLAKMRGSEPAPSPAKAETAPPTPAPAAEQGAPARPMAPKPVASKPLHEMTGAELRDHAHELNRYEKQAAIDVFGPEDAAKYEKAQRTSNSSFASASSPTLKAADALIDEMESRLTPEQQKRLFGIGEEGATFEDVRDIARKVAWVEGAGSPKELAEVLAKPLSDLGNATDPATMSPAQLEAYAMLRRAQDVMAREGWDPKAVGGDALRGAFDRFSDPEDAAFMLERFAKPAKPAGERPGDYRLPTPERSPALNGEQPQPPASTGSDPFLSRMRSRGQSGSVPIVDYAKAAGGWIESTEKIAKPAVEAVGAKLKQTFPRAADLAERAYTHVLRSPERKISQGFEDVVMEGRATERGLASQGKKAVVDFEKATKGLTEAQREQVGRSLSSEEADLSTLDPPTRTAVESLRSTERSFSEREVQAKTKSPEVHAEYPQGHLKRVLKPAGIVERAMGRRGGISVRKLDMAQDMHKVELTMPEAEARGIVQELGLSPRLLKQYGSRTTIKFNPDEYGAAERQAFTDEVNGRFSEARSKLGADATREIKAGDVGQAKGFMRAQADVPTAGDIDMKTSDPIPPEVASKIFEPGVAKRAHVTLQESARRIGKAETLRDISKLVDEKGPIAIEPKSISEPAPEGYELVDNKNFGELHRKFVRKDALEYVRGVYDGTSKGMVRGIGDGLMERFKVVQLAYAPRQAFRQFVSNMEFENLAGMSNWNVPRYLVSKIKGVRAMREASPYREALVKNGFLDPAHVSEAELGLAEQELSSTRYDVGRRIGRALGTLGVSEVAPNKLRATERQLWRWYSTSDAWTKATIYVHAIEELKLSPKDAAAYVRKWTPSPESVSSMVKSYSGSILGDPWARFKAETIRINSTGIREGKLVRLAMNWKQKQLIRAAAVLGGASLLSDDEDKALTNEQGTGAVALGRNEKGEPLAADYSFLSTMGDLFVPPKKVGKDWDNAKDRFLQLTGFGDNPLYSTASQLITGEDMRTGRPLNPEGSISGGVKSTLALIGKQWTPAIFTRNAAKINAAWNDEPYSVNQPKQTKPQAVLDVFFGFKLSPLDADQALNKIARQGSRALNDLRSSFRDKVIQGETIDRERMVELADALMKDYNERAEPLKAVQEKRTMGSGR